MYVAFYGRKFDLVHIHGVFLLSLFLPFKPKIIEFHGTDVRSCPDGRWWIQRKVTDLFLRLNRRKQFYVSTPDLVNEVTKPLRILHVFDCACVGECMAKNQRRLGYVVEVAKFGADYDGSGMDAYYGTSQIFRPDSVSLYHKAKKHLPKNYWLRRVLYKMWHFYPTIQFYFYVARHYRKYDVLHIHSVWPIIFFTPFKKKIIEFHGDDVRHKPTFHNRANRFLTSEIIGVVSRFFHVYVSTDDLLNDVKKAVWIPNPVDTDLFTPECYKPEPYTALYCHNWYEDGSHAREYAEKHGLKLKVLERASQEWVKYNDFPNYLGKFEYYIDRVAIHSLSKSALEMLAMGGKVVDWHGEVLQGLPKEHLPENVAKFTISIYKKVLGDKK